MAYRILLGKIHLERKLFSRNGYIYPPEFNREEKPCKTFGKSFTNLLIYRNITYSIGLWLKANLPTAGSTSSTRRISFNIDVIFMFIHRFSSSVIDLIELSIILSLIRSLKNKFYSQLADQSFVKPIDLLRWLYT